MNMLRRSAVACLTLAAFAPLTAIAQSATAFPTKPVRIVVPFAPGGTSDSLARVLGQKLSEMWNQPVLVENKAGADGNVGADYVAKSPADGYTLMLLDIGTLTMAPVFYARLSFDPLKDFAPVTLIQFSPHALVVTNSLPAKNVSEVVAFSRANPGKLNFAASNNSARLAGAQFQQATGTDMLQIPYKGAGAAMTAVIGGEANITLNGLFIASPHIKAGKVKPIAVASAKRMPSVPDIPTMIELGVPNFVTGSWQGLFAPANTPSAVVTKINADLIKVLNTAEIRARLTEQGAEVIGSSPDHLGALVKEQTATFLNLARTNNIKPE
jgi:tripartite-type tricarboxylate transporter receptor subunit TctC